MKKKRKVVEKYLKNQSKKYTHYLKKQINKIMILGGTTKKQKQNRKVV